MRERSELSNLRYESVEGFLWVLEGVAWIMRARVNYVEDAVKSFYTLCRAGVTAKSHRRCHRVSARTSAGHAGPFATQA